MKTGMTTISVLVATGLSALAAADSIFSDDFQDGNYNGWTIGGAGSSAIANYYYGNYTLRLRNQKTATQAVPTTGFVNVEISAGIAASSLEGSDTCDAQVSTNGGSSWVNFHSVANGADDGVTLWYGTGSPSGVDNNGDLQLRLRASGNNNADYCYFDNIQVSGDAAADISTVGSGDLGDVAVNATGSEVITLVNDGPQNLSITSLSGLASPFGVNNDNCSGKTIAPGASCSLTLQFSPTAGGNFTDVLNISLGGSVYPLDVSGYGGGPTCDYDCLSGNGSVNRSSLTYTTLQNTGNGALVDDAAFAVPPRAANPSNTFEGSLQFTSVVRGWQAQKDTYNYGGTKADVKKLPNFDYMLVQHGTHLIPQQRGLIRTGNPSWEIILEPGRVWDEAGDNGYSRAALPFALQQRNANCTHNGVMSFLFKNDGSVSSVAYQISAETCLYYQFDMWGLLGATYVPGNVSGAGSIKSDYENEVADRMPTRLLSELANDYPGAGIDISKIGAEITPEHISVNGVVYNGVNYASRCRTRTGFHPYCEVMNLPSYSTAKSIVGGVGLMYLEHQNPGSQSGLIVDNYVAECSGSQWSDVTFEDLADMTTGNYTSATYMADEASNAMANGFFLEETDADKIAFACSYSRKATPGTKFVYHTSDTYVLGRAMDQYLGADTYTQLYNTIYAPLGVSPTMETSIRTYDTALQALTGFGLTYHHDDIVKLAEFLNTEDGAIGANQLLDPGMLDAALQRNSGDRGVDVYTGDPSSKYNNSFWSYNVNASPVVSACTTDKWVPYMSGYGGIAVVLLPTDMVYYAFSDNDEHFWTTTINELNKISAICQ